MQSENFDNKVRQAAEQHHPNYDEKAWSRMEKLLEQHLPQKKDDGRKFILLLLCLLFLGGGAWLFVDRPWNHDNRSAGIVDDGVSKKPVQSVSRPESEHPSDPSQKNSENASVTAQTSANPALIPGREIQQSDQLPLAVSDKPAKSTLPSKSFRKKDNAEDILTVDQNNPARTKQNKNLTTGNDNSSTASSPSGKDQIAVAGEDKSIDKPVATATVDAAVTNKIVEEPKNGAADKTQLNAQATATPQQKKLAKKSSSKRNYFFFSFSAGPDRSSVKMENPGEIKLLVGAGAGFTIHDKWTIRTGFYSSDKVYTASKYDYKPPTPIINPNYLDEINANCKVYEIPLNVSYNFSNSAKHSFFATTGLSSFIMKKEEYQYLYKYPGNPPTTYTYTKTLNNENQHYFSVLTISGGYEYRVSKTFSLSGEPYLKLPLAGIGFGKVKLNSAGILFSANIRPFH